MPRGNNMCKMEGIHWSQIQQAQRNQENLSGSQSVELPESVLDSPGRGTEGIGAGGQGAGA